MDDAAFQAQQDQYLASLKDTARNARAFHELLTGEGFSGDEAAVITGHWLGASVSAHVNKAALDALLERGDEADG